MTWLGKCYRKIVTGGEIPNNNFKGTKIKDDPGWRGIKKFDTDYVLDNAQTIRNKSKQTRRAFYSSLYVTHT